MLDKTRIGTAAAAAEIPRDQVCDEEGQAPVGQTEPLVLLFLQGKVCGGQSVGSERSWIWCFGRISVFFSSRNRVQIEVKREVDGQNEKQWE